MKLLKRPGASSQILQVFIADSSSTTGAGLTGLAYNSGSLVAYYHRDTDTTATAISLVTMTVGTFTSSGFKEIDSTNMPGWYQLCVPDVAFAWGAASVAIHLKGATNMAPLAIEVEMEASLFGIADGGIAQAGTSTSITLRSGASATDHTYEGDSVVIVKGTGAGQAARPITGYVGSTTVATVDGWTIQPDSTSEYLVIQTPVGSATVNLMTTVLAESYAAAGAAMTPMQALSFLVQAATNFGVSGGVQTIKKLDGSTQAAQVTFNSSTVPTSASRTA